MALVEKVNSNIDRLIQTCEDLKSDKVSLNDANQLMEKTINEQQDQIKELHGHMEMLKMAKSLAVADGKTTDAKLKINELVREIDKCISLLNK
ncbi:MAG: archaellum component FlaC [Parvicellaceae bacterium]|jgi:archaellum component FlaC